MRAHRPNFRPQPPTPQQLRPQLIIWRERIVFYVFISIFVVLGCRFFWLQVVQGREYEALAQLQYRSTSNEDVGNRGRIFDTNGNLLVGNRNVYQYYAQANQVADPAALYDLVAPIILADPEASSSLRPRERFLSEISQKAETSNYIFLANKVSQETKEALDVLELPCISAAGNRCLKVETQLRRYYPEGTLAAHVIGFLSRDNQTGHYGIEGGLNKELAGKAAPILAEADATGVGMASSIISEDLDGRDVYLSLDRDLQYLVENTLEAGVKRFGAERGEIIITEPSTGRILALAAYPNYNPENYYDYDASLYKNPSVYDYYEPGSTFKVLTMAAAIDSGVVAPNTVCTKCYGPRTIAGKTINNWNGVANGAITMTQALEKSDNIALVWVSDLLGAERFRAYLKKFGIGQSVDLEVEEQNEYNFPEVWGPVETATRSFGQGVTVTSLQLVRAVGAIANGGKLKNLTLVDKAVDKATGEVFSTPADEGTAVIAPESAKTMREMMQTAAQHGEAQYIFKNSDLIAGKTGTAQIPQKGGYSDETIASFIGFAPYNDPKFLMLVKYERPKTSIYAAETAAVTWKELAEKLFIRFDIKTEADTN